MLKLATKVALTAFLAMVGLTAFSGSAHASRSLSLSPAGSISAISLGKLTFRTTLGGAPVNYVECDVTLHGSLNRIIPKRSGTLFGKIHQASIFGCTSPITSHAFSISTSLIGSGWKLVYSTFAGRLPAPTAVSAHLIGMSFLYSLPDAALACLYEGNVPMTFNLAGTPPDATGLITLPTGRVPLRSTLPGSTSCPTGHQLVGSFRLTPTQMLILVN